MDKIERNTGGLTVLVDLNWDRFIFSGAIVAALGLSVALGNLM